MRPDDLDAILLLDKRIEPSSTFARNVMVRIQTEEIEMRPVPFPWIRLAAAFLVISILSLWLFPAEAFLRATYSLSYDIDSWIASLFSNIVLPNALLSASASLLGSLVLVWFSLRLAGASR